MLSTETETSTGASVGLELQWEEETEDCWDPEKLLRCPYDPHHMIRACRFSYHLIKCKKNHPELASQLKTCPFNARHLMPRCEMPHHIANCLNKCFVNTDYGSNESYRKFLVPVHTWTSPVTDENWDEEVTGATTSAPPAVCSGSTSQVTQNSLRSKFDTVGNLTPGLRAPKTLPWRQGLSQ